MTDWQLRESTQGKLALFKGDTLVADPVMPVLAFPFSAPEESISIETFFGVGICDTCGQRKEECHQDTVGLTVDAIHRDCRKYWVWKTLWGKYADIGLYNRTALYWLIKYDVD